ncbi:LysR substrate-binding domain-containing protein [Bradyrhizobium sp. dw_78]|uniref:LysR substrate-binding domain-containing protein n=1 Tax=Bradyrhizobium sp. dw_78 TaxID=2719793 RepID=UPI001BD63C07|nr:LysR substrate-binding domain-containing protein [Bradyrhizobium sp. dw_78]
MNTAMSVELRLMRTFVAVAEELHYRRAADRLNTTQSAVSLRIQELERQLGTKLLERTRRAVALTASGRVVHLEGKELLARADQLVRRARAMQEGRSGVITIGTIGAVTLEVLPNFIQVARATGSELDFKFVEMGGRDQLEALRRGQIDIGFVRSEARSPGLSFKSVHTEPVICLLPSDHRLAARTEISISELEGEPVVNLARERDPAAHDFYMSLYRAAGFEPLIAHEASELPTILFAVSSLGCVSIGPQSWRALQRDGVKLMPIANPAPCITTQMVWNSSACKPACKMLIEAFS